MTTTNEMAAGVPIVQLNSVCNGGMSELAWYVGLHSVIMEFTPHLYRGVADWPCGEKRKEIKKIIKLPDLLAHVTSVSANSSHVNCVPIVVNYFIFYACSQCSHNFILKDMVLFI